LYSLDLESLSELDIDRRLIEIYLYGLPNTVHFIVDPRKSLSWRIVLPVLSFPIAQLRSLVDELGDRPSTNDLAARRKEFFRHNPSKAPSSEAQHLVRHTQRIMLCGRPEENDIPPSLLDETLCDFRHDVCHIGPDARDFLDFYKLRQAMIQTYDTEAERRDALINVLHKVLPNRPEPGSIDRYNNNGQLSITTALLRAIILYYIQEIKNEVGSTTAEPNLEVIRYYLENCRRLCRAGITEHCNLPAILLCQIGMS
jgi:hypothetical protein